MLTCHVRPALRLTTSEVRLGLQSIRQPGFERVVDAEAVEQVARIDVPPSQRWTVEVTGSPRGPRDRQIRIRAVEPIAPGVVDERLVFIPIDDQGRRLPESELRITGEFVPDIACEPREVRFGRIPVGSVVEDTITIRSLTGRPCTVNTVTTSPPDLTTGPAERRNDQWVCRVTCRVRVAGEQSADLRIEVTDDAGRVTIVVVPVRVTGVNE
jgi:hypothetical protein